VIDIGRLEILVWLYGTASYRDAGKQAERDGAP
jgi:hypothetical protein